MTPALVAPPSRCESARSRSRFTRRAHIVYRKSAFPRPSTVIGAWAPEPVSRQKTSIFSDNSRFIRLPLHRLSRYRILSRRRLCSILRHQAPQAVCATYPSRAYPTSSPRNSPTSNVTIIAWTAHSSLNSVVHMHARHASTMLLSTPGLRTGLRTDIPSTAPSYVFPPTPLAHTGQESLSLSTNALFCMWTPYRLTLVALGQRSLQPFDTG